MDPSLEELASKIQALGREARTRVGERDVVLLKRLKRLSRASEALGRLALHLASSPLGWIAGVTSLAFSLSLESQLNHSIMHGAYAGLPGAERFGVDDYESLALPFQSRTWRDAHRIHHAQPSLLEQDPDTVHPLFRVHADQPWRPWHLFNTFLGAVLVFECWALDYDRFLKKAGLRPSRDRGELRKLARFVAYQYLLFPALAGSHWKQVLLGNLAAVVIRNFVFVGLQTASSVGPGISTAHCRDYGKKSRGEWTKFQVETSKNFVVPGIWKILCGGLDRHIEHHLFPQLPPGHYQALSVEVRELCRSHGLDYREFPAFSASLKDSLSYLAGLSLRR